MNTRLALVLALTTPIAFSSCRLHAQAGRRPPTAAEKAAVARFQDAILQTLAPVANEDWESDPTGDRDIPDDYMVTLRPEVPFEITGTIERSYRVTPGSPYYQREMAPLLAKAQGMSDPQAMKAVFEHMDRTQLSISVEFNRTNVSIDDQPPRLRNLTVPDVPIAWQIAEDRQKKVALLFGRWAAASHAQGGLHYRFRQPGKYLAIENIVIELEGNAPRIDDLLKTLDWKRIDAALSPAD